MKSLRLTLFFLFVLASCAFGQQPDLQGHRGARGVYPENTVPAFLYAVTNGMTTLELDVVISKDRKVVVSHEPWLNDKICLDQNGNPVPGGKEKDYNLFEMTYEEIAKCDCGSQGNPRFPDQDRIEIAKPLLSAVIDTVEAFTRTSDYAPMRYNIEIKSKPSHDGEFHPGIEEFSTLVLDVIEEKGIAERTNIQCFDVRPLQYIRKKSDIPLALLVANGKSVQGNIDKLGFTPEIYSPYYKLLSKRSVRKAHEMGMKVIPWTVNDRKKMEKMFRIGVDGIISDYPELLKSVADNLSGE